MSDKISALRSEVKAADDKLCNMIFEPASIEETLQQAHEVIRALKNLVYELEAPPF